MRQHGLRRRLALALGVAAGVIALDQATKVWSETSLVDGRIEVIPGLLWFTYAENTGASFSLFQGRGSIIGVVAIGAVIFVLASLRTERPALEVVGLGFVLGGAVGNLIDRFRRGDGLLDGPVVDWIQVPNFPIFNIADSALTIGVVLLLISAWRHRHEEHPRAGEHPESHEV